MISTQDQLISIIEDLVDFYGAGNFNHAIYPKRGAIGDSVFETHNEKELPLGAYAREKWLECCAITKSGREDDHPKGIWPKS